MYASHTIKKAHDVESMENERKMENMKRRKLVES